MRKWQDLNLSLKLSFLIFFNSYYYFLRLCTLTLKISVKSNDLISLYYQKTPKSVFTCKTHLLSMGTPGSAAWQNELFLLVEGLSKQLCEIQCLYNEQSIVYSQYKHSQPWIKVKAPETQNRANWADALIVVGEKFLFGLVQLFCQGAAMVFL